MLAAAKAEAAKDGASLTVLDANNNPATQLSQLQAATSSGKYNALIVEPIFGPGLITAVKSALAKGLKVANVDEILGSNLTSHAAEVPGLTANIVFVSHDLGYRMGELTVKACEALHRNPCTVGFMYDFKATPFDVALRAGFNEAIAGHNIQVVTEGQSMYTITVGANAAQTMIAAHPNLDVIVGADQGIEGASRVVPSHVILIGYGGSAAALNGIGSGRWYGDVVQLPASEGRLAVQDLVKAVKTGQTFPGVELSDSLPANGLVTKANVNQFHAEWAG
jgi:ribose transport system substrate-binding protein